MFSRLKKLNKQAENNLLMYICDLVEFKSIFFDDEDIFFYQMEE